MFKKDRGQFSVLKDRKIYDRIYSVINYAETSKKKDYYEIFKV